MHRILVVEDEPNIRMALRVVLESEGFLVDESAEGSRAMKMLEDEDYSLVILDLKMPGMDGMAFLDATGSLQSRPPVVVISGQATTHEALETVRRGAFDFLEKPIDRSRLLVTVKNAIEHARLMHQRDDLARRLGLEYEMVGTSPSMVEVYRQIERIAPTRGRVLILGESGTGKELVARAIHRHSPVSRGPFVKVNCAAIPPELIESELFGHEKGAFTGAVHRRRGMFELAHSGTIFLDEVGDMSLMVQAKLLRVLQTGEFTRVGGEKTVKVDVRVIAATNKDLEAMVREGTFREDLYFRLSVLQIRVPPLRDRREDIPVLVDAFVDEFCREYGLRPKEVEPKVMDVLQSYSWPGNVRELKNLVERMVILSDEHITLRHLPPGFSSQPVSPSDLSSYSHMTLREFRQEMERRFIVMKLDENEWNITRTAEQLGMERTNLHKKIKALGLERSKKD